MFLRRYRERSYEVSWHTGHFPSRGLLVYRVSMQVPHAIYPSRATYSYYSRLGISGGRHNNARHFNPSPTRTASEDGGGDVERARARACARSFFFFVRESRANPRYGDIKFRWIANGGTETTRSRSDLNPDLTGRAIFRSSERRYKPRPWESTRSLDSAVRRCCITRRRYHSFSSR